MNEQQVLWLLGKVGALITDSHIIYTSGKHGTAYVDKDELYPHTKATSDLCREIAWHFVDDDVEAVVAPEKGGIILSQWVAFHLSEITGREVLAFYAEKKVVKVPDTEGKGRQCYAETGGFAIKRGGAETKLCGKNVLVVEDILTTGGSAKKVIEAVRAFGSNIIGLGVLCNRGGVMPKDVAYPQRFFALVNVAFDAWDEAECPLCAGNVPINTDVGHGREYLARRAH